MVDGWVIDKAAARGRHVGPARGAKQVGRAAVIKREDTVFLGLRPPQRDHGLQPLTLAGRQIHTFGEVAVQVVQLPDVVFIRYARLVARYRFPALVHQRAVTEHLEILRSTGHLRLCMLEGVQQAAAVHGRLRHLRHLVWRFNTDGCQDGRGNVDGVAELAADAARTMQVTGPVQQQRVAHATAVGVLLVPLERAVADLRPAPGNVAVAVRPADVVQPLHCRIHILAHAVEVTHLIQDAGRATLLAGAVVRQQNKQRVVPCPQAFDVVDQPSNLGIGVFQHGGIGFLQPCGKPLLVARQFGPRAHTGITRRELGARRNDAHRQLALEPRLALDIPAGIEATPVFVQIGLGRLVWRVHGAKRQVQEKWLLRHQRLQVADAGVGLVHHVF